MGKIIFIHGIGDSKSDYWHEWRERVANAIGTSKFDLNRDYHGVWWEGIMDDYSGGGEPGKRSLKAPSLTDKASKLKDEINTTIHRELLRWCKGKGKTLDRSMERGFIGDYLGDFGYYLLDAALADKVQKQLRDKLIELSQQDTELHIICHSWGTVVTYDVLSRWDKCPKISSLITIGSPLWIPVVRIERRKYPEKTMRWTNVDNEGNGFWEWFNGDPIGGYLNIYDDHNRFKNMSIHSKAGHLAVGYLGDDEMTGILLTSLRVTIPPGVAERALEPRKPKKKALLVAINEYPFPIPPLYGCINDSFLVNRMLQEVHEFPTKDIHMVHNHRATTNKIRNKIEWLLDGAKSGDTLLLHYSGHGTQIPERIGDEVDGLDECIVPYDFDSDAPRLIDNDFRELFGNLPAGVKLTVIFDCCHSGTGTRGESIKVRGFLPPMDILNRVYEFKFEGSPLPVFKLREEFADKKRRLLREMKREKDEYIPIALSACKDSQTAKEYPVGGANYGAFTYFICHEIYKNKGKKLTYGNLTKMCGQSMKLADIQDQTPQLNGPRKIETSMFLL